MVSTYSELSFLTCQPKSRDEIFLRGGVVTTSNLEDRTAWCEARTVRRYFASAYRVSASPASIPGTHVGDNRSACARPYLQLPCPPFPPLLPRARAEQSCPAAAAPTNLGRRSSIPRAHGLLTSPSVFPAPHRTRLSPTPTGIDSAPADLH